MGLDFGQLHFADAFWLWGALAAPAIFALYALFYKRTAHARQLRHFADAHLLPHLIKNAGGAKKFPPGNLARWSLAWLFGMVAMAGPRFGYTDVKVFQPERDLVVVLDLSQSMNAADVKPSRIARAQQEIEDILNLQKGVTIGLVAYAAVPHMVAPLTDDMKTLQALVPALDPSLVTVQGDSLKPALRMASRMLDGEPHGNDKSILVVSDGNFDAGDIAGLVKAAGGAKIYAMGIGTPAGAPVPDGGGFVDAANGNMLISRLQAGRLKTLARLGQGVYVRANYTHDDTDAILARVEGRTGGAIKAAPKTVRIWNERFYIPVLLLTTALVPLFRRGALFPAALLALFLFSPAQARAADFKTLFFNTAQQGKIAYDAHDYAGAMKTFKTPYRRGVAAYRARQFDKAERLFKTETNPKLRSPAQYNAANAALMQGKIKEAIAGYEAVLKGNRQDARARHNLAIAKKLLKLQKKRPQEQQGNQKKQNKEDDQQKSDSKGDKSAKTGTQEQKPERTAAAQGQKSGVKKNKASAPEAQKEIEPEAQKEIEPEAQKETAPKAREKAAQKQAGQKQPLKKERAARRTPQGESAPRPPSQKDIDADRWLDHIQSDPGSFLQNQFRIEEKKARAAEEETP